MPANLSDEHAVAVQIRKRANRTGAAIEWPSIPASRACQRRNGQRRRVTDKPFGGYLMYSSRENCRRIRYRYEGRYRRRWISGYIRPGGKHDSRIGDLDSLRRSNSLPGLVPDLQLAIAVKSHKLARSGERRAEIATFRLNAIAALLSARW